jgi:pimeloyl-ACP methyl ester carboxylesterase
VRRAPPRYRGPVRTESVDTGDVRLSCLVAGAGPVVLAQHGFPDAREAFLPLVPALTSAGYSVVLPTLRGYAPSGVARSGRHHAVAAGEDLCALARHFGGGRPVRLIGHDWGALAAFAAVAAEPDLFAQLVTMAVPHPAAMLARVRPAQLARSWYIGLFQLPWVAEARLARDDLALVDRLWRDWSPTYTPAPETLANIKAGLRERLGPALAYYRALTSPAVQREARAASGVVRVPAIHLHGELDGCIGIECTDGAEAHYARGYALHRVADAGHFLVHERPDEVSARLLAFFGPGADADAPRR